MLALRALHQLRGKLVHQLQVVLHPKLELLVTVESLEFPVDGLAQAVITVATVELTDPDLQRLKVEFRRVDGGWKVMRADRAER